MGIFITVQENEKIFANISKRISFNELKEISKSKIEYLKDPSKWEYGFDLDIGKVIIPKTTRIELKGKIPKDAEYYVIGKRKNIFQTKSQSEITYYKRIEKE